MALTKKMLGERIMRFRKIKGLSQEDLARDSGISRSAIAKIEIGLRTVSALELQAIGQTLGFSIDDFLAAGAGSFMPATTAEMLKRVSPTPGKCRTVLLYLLESCAGKPNVGETVLYKMLYFSDFNFYERYQEYLTGMKYRKLPFGPVPLYIEHFINYLVERKDVQRMKCRYQGYMQTRYVPLQSPDLNLLTVQEQVVIKEVIGAFSDMSAAAISAVSHQDQPWILSENGAEIDYELALKRRRPFSAER